MIPTDRPKGTSLGVVHLGPLSCLRVGAMAGLMVGTATFVVAFVLWQLIMPGVETSVAAAFQGSHQLGTIFGPGVGACVALVLGAAAALGTIALAAVVPPLYNLAARRISGLSVVLTS